MASCWSRCTLKRCRTPPHIVLALLPRRFVCRFCWSSCPRSVWIKRSIKACRCVNSPVNYICTSLNQSCSLKGLHGPVLWRTSEGQEKNHPNLAGRNLEIEPKRGIPSSRDGWKENCTYNGSTKQSQWKLFPNSITVLSSKSNHGCRIDIQLKCDCR